MKDSVPLVVEEVTPPSGFSVYVTSPRGFSKDVVLAALLGFSEDVAPPPGFSEVVHLLTRARRCLLFAPP